MLALGMLALAVADIVLALAGGYTLLFVGIALSGLHMGLTQGILASLITDVAPPAYRGTAFGVFNLVSGEGLARGQRGGGLAVGPSRRSADVLGGRRNRLLAAAMTFAYTAPNIEPVAGQ